jgi:hypothetical protein
MLTGNIRAEGTLRKSAMQGKCLLIFGTKVHGNAQLHVMRCRLQTQQ